MSPLRYLTGQVLSRVNDNRNINPKIKIPEIILVSHEHDESHEVPQSSSA